MSDTSVELVSGFWLPSEFLTDDDFVMENNTSVVTENYAENSWFMSTSPQSTLANMGSPNGAPFGGKNEDFGDVVSRAASEVAMLKLGDRFGVGPNQGTRFMGPHSCFFQHPKNPTPPRQQTYNGVTPYGQRQMYGNRVEMGQGAWTMHHNPTRIGSGRLTGSGVGVKRGTGVFLPRPCRYESNRNISNSRMKQTGGGSTTLIPDRAATHASNNTVDNVTGFIQSHLLSQPMFNMGYIQDYDLLMARRHAIMLRQQRSLLLAKRSSVISRETCLPQEWTY